MVYSKSSVAHFIGLQHVAGKIAGRTGSFILQVSGAYADGVAKANWSVVPDSGTGELQGLRGTGGYPDPQGEASSFTLDYTLE